MPKKPLYTATKSLETSYTFNLDYEQNKVVVGAAQKHALLFAGVDGLLQQFNETYDLNNGKGKGTKKKTIAKTNFATAAFTFLYTDTTPKEGHLGDDIEQKSFCVNVPSAVSTDRILCSESFYGNSDKDYKVPKVAGNKGRRNKSFNASLRRRVAAFSEVADEFTFPQNTVSSWEDLEVAIAGPMFPETFHHSEQALMYFLSSKEGLEAIVAALSTCKNVSYLYGIVLDIYTQRVLCCNCNASLIGLQRSQDSGFLSDLSTKLDKDRSIQSRENLMLSTRVSASQGVEVIRLVDDDKIIAHGYDPDVTNLIYQAENQTLGTRKIIKDSNYSLATFPGAFFTSREIPCKIKLENQIRVEHNHPACIGEVRPK